MTSSYFPLSICADVTQAKKVIGWKPEHNSEEGLKDTVEENSEVYFVGSHGSKDIKSLARKHGLNSNLIMLGFISQRTRKYSLTAGECLFT